jgi:pseudaminic acid biosynthesis-associated methylase
LEIDRVYSTEQEAFWAGSFGDSYLTRNRGPHREAANRWLFSRALQSVGPLNSVLELGANIGANLSALRSLYPDLTCEAVEINVSAVNELRTQLDEQRVHLGSLLDFDGRPRMWDLVLCKGVLIHISPAELPRAYDVIARSASRFVVIAEYYSPRPMEVEYRGHADRLFKRDFAGEFLDRYSDFGLRDYGFAYHRDPVAAQDDITWFLLERQSPIDGKS